MRPTAVAASLSALVAAAEGGIMLARAGGPLPPPTDLAPGEQNCAFYWFEKKIFNFEVKVGKDDKITTIDNETWLFDCSTTSTVTRNIYNKAAYVQLIGEGEHKTKNGSWIEVFSSDWRNAYHPSVLYRSVDIPPQYFDKTAEPIRP